MNPLIQSKNTTILPVLIALALACFAPVSQVRATCQEGCLPNQNTVLGDDALLNNTIGSSNTAVGSDALALNTAGFDNTAVGNGALFANRNGSFNTATGRGALQSNATGHKNTADGGFALYLNTTGSFNTATGTEALYFNTTGSSNIALGYQAGQRLTTGSNNIDIGNDGHVGESSTIRIGTARTQTNAYVAGISGVTVPTGVPVIVDSSGHLGTTTSSASFKGSNKAYEQGQ